LDLWSYSIKHKQFNQHAWDGINSSGSEYAPVLSPDGKFIAFLSDRTGHPELWVYDTSNSKLTQLTNFEGSLDIRAPAWHPSGKSLVFNVFSPETHADIYTVDITGTPPEPLIANPSNEREPDWSRDGKSLLFGSDQTGKWQIWKYHPKENRRVQHTTDGGYKARFASKNTEFYFTKYDQTGIWRYHSDGTEERIINAPLGAMHNTWAIGKNGIYYELLESGSLFPELYFYDFNQRKIQNIATLKGLKIVKDIAVLSQKNQIIISGARESESGIFLFSRKERKKPQL
jgi:Tol biopolymer transport system component